MEARNVGRHDRELRSSGAVKSIVTRSGLVTTLTYDGGNRLTQIAGPFGHRLTLAYDAANRVSQMTAPDGGVFHYAYDAKSNLAAVTYPGGATRKYLYETTTLPHALTGLIDEDGVRYATWQYDAKGRAISSQHAGGADLTTLSYSPDLQFCLYDGRTWE